MVQREMASVHFKESKPGGESVKGMPNTSFSMPNRSSSVGNEKRMGESR
jgi:hypothetical protein